MSHADMASNGAKVRLSMNVRVLEAISEYLHIRFEKPIDYLSIVERLEQEVG